MMCATIDKAALRARLHQLAEEMRLPGVSAFIMGPDGPAFDWQYGVRDAKGAPVSAQTMFGIASMSKSITALCLCILETEGRLRLDDPVCDYLPDFRVPGQPREAVTLRHLAMHTAGIPPMEPLEWSIAMNSEGRGESEWLMRMRQTAPNKMETIDQIVDYIARCPYKTLGAPGEVMSYCNEGYAILSAVADKAAGEPLERFMQRRVFEPLGMTRSVLDNGIEQARALSGGDITSLFEVEDGARTCDDAWSVLPPFRGCAMVKSTARDMAVYYRALSNMGVHEGKQVIPARAVELLIGRYHPLSEHAAMCLGLYKREKAGHTICEHSGGLHGVSSKGGLLLGEGYGFAVLCNQGDENMDELLGALLNAVIGLPLDASHAWFTPVPRAFSAPQMLAGRYVDHEGIPGVAQIREEDGRLRGERNGEAFDLVYCGGTRFIGVDPKKPGRTVCRLEFLIRDGRAWAVRVGTRVALRED